MYVWQHGQAPMKTHHLEYTEGGILDMDDLLTDLVEDRDKVGHFISFISRVYFYFLSSRQADRRDRMSNKQGICKIQSSLLVLSLLVQASTY